MVNVVCACTLEANAKTPIKSVRIFFIEKFDLVNNIVYVTLFLIRVGLRRIVPTQSRKVDYQLKNVFDDVHDNLV